MAHRFVRLASAAILQLAALVLAHQLVYLARYGSRFGEALQHAGHGDAWTAAVMSSVLLAVALGAFGIARLVHLGFLIRRSSATDPGASGELERGALARAFLRIAPRTALLTALLLTAQENLERAAIGLPTPGAGMLLTDEYQGGLWITIAVALVVSLVAALFAWRRGVLEARLRAARPPIPR